mgnify:CR=1 FL=1
MFAVAVLNRAKIQLLAGSSKFMVRKICCTAQKKRLDEVKPLFYAWKAALSLCFCLGCGDDGDVASVLLTFLEADGAIDESVESVILAHAHVVTGMVDGASLTNDDVAGLAGLATKNLHAQALAC